MDELLEAIFVGGDVELVKQLLKQGADPNVFISNSTELLIKALEHSHTKFLSGVHNRFRVASEYRIAFQSMCSRFAQDKSLGRVLLHLSDLLREKRGYEIPDPIVRSLTGGVGADVRSWLVHATRGWHGVSALHLALYCEHEAVALALLESGADPNNLWYGRSPLIQATSFECVKVVSQLLAMGVDVNHVIHVGEVSQSESYFNDSFLGSTALHVAASVGNISILNALLEHGASTEPTSNRIDAWSAMNIAASKGHHAIVSRLLSTGAKPDSSSLHIAAKKGHADVIRVLLAAGADPNRRGEDLKGESLYATPLISATIGNHVRAVEMLLLSGADANYRDDFGRNALDHAKAAKNDRIVALLRPKTKKFLGLF